MTPRCVWLWNRVSLFWWKFCPYFFFFKDGDTHACPCVSRRTSVAYLAVMTSWWGTRDTGFYTRNNRKSSHCTGALPLIDSQLNVWLVTNNRLAVARAAHCEVGELVTDGKLICYRVCLISLFPFHSFFSSLSLRQLSRDQTPLLSPSLLQGSATVFIMPQSPPVRWSNESWLKSETLACRLCRVYFFSRHRYLIAPPPRTILISPRLCLSVWLMVWNIERCLFLLWLARQGALWQTTRDQIDYAASLWSRRDVVIVSGPYRPPGRKSLQA